MWDSDYLDPTLKNQKTYAFEDEYRIPEVMLPNLGVRVQYKARASRKQMGVCAHEPVKDAMAMSRPAAMNGHSGSRGQRNQMGRQQLGGLQYRNSVT